MPFTTGDGGSGGRGSEGGSTNTSELRMGMVVIVFWESGRGTRDGMFGFLAGLGLELELEFDLGSGLTAISSSEEVMLMTSDAGTGFDVGLGLVFSFFDFVLEFGFDFDFGIDVPSLLGVAVVFRNRIFARSAREGANIPSRPVEFAALNIDALSIVDGPASIKVDSSGTLAFATCAPL
jgi:hypothetical protein